MNVTTTTRDVRSRSLALGNVAVTVWTMKTYYQQTCLRSSIVRVTTA
jgi:hypothetical protein